MNRQGRAPHLTITATAATVLALADMPAALEGYGVIPAALARQVAARATWEPLLLDARTGAPLARSTRRYVPTQALRDAVVQRDGTCRFPGCRRPAGQCDIDHVEPFRDAPSDEPRAGLDHREPQTRIADLEPQTRIDNLQALCRRHHRAKTHGGWRVSVEADGSRRWISPSGHVYSPSLEPPVIDPPDLLDSLEPGDAGVESLDLGGAGADPPSPRQRGIGPSDFGAPRGDSPDFGVPRVARDFGVPRVDAPDSPPF